jgi:hypothetical protein
VKKKRALEPATLSQWSDLVDRAVRSTDARRVEALVRTGRRMQSTRALIEACTSVQEELFYVAQVNAMNERLRRRLAKVDSKTALARQLARLRKLIATL